jgi:hypothetical protein
MSRLDVKRNDEIQRRQGATVRTIISTIWLGLSFVGAYFLIQYLDSSGALTYNMIYSRLFIPRSIPEWVIQGALMLIVVMISQFALVAGFAFATPIGRTRPGTPSMLSRNPDPLDDQRFR